MIETGQQFGLYVVKEVFSGDEKQGCCCAEDPFFNREVLLKVFATEFLPTGRLEQLEALLERLAVLDHPSIAPIYDSGQEENTFYYTTANYPSGSLAERWGKPLSAQQALKITYQLTEALDYALEHEFGQDCLQAEKICFDEDGRAVLVDFAIDAAIMQSADSGEAEEFTANVASSLRSLGELLLKMLLGPAYDSDERIDDLCAKIDNTKVRQLVGRFLLPGEWRFASFAELLEELRCFDEIEAQINGEGLGQAPELSGFEQTSLPPDEQAEKMVSEVRRLVAEKNSLQQALDNALFQRNQTDNKLAEGQRQLAQYKQEIAKAKEEANVAWELVAGQKYDRWRPVVWAAGGFLLGFVLSGSYGYYYSEQTRNELLAKLKANEELIKSAAWRPAEEQQAKPEPKPAEPVAVAKNVADEAQPADNAVAPEPRATLEVEEDQEEPIVAVTPDPVAVEPRQWWPAGSEFSSAAAIPIEQLKAALGFSRPQEQANLSELLQQEVTAAVRRWAEAWSRQDLNSYFSMYSDNYRPELGRSQDEWRDMRRSRVTRPQWIELDIEDIRVRKVSEDRIQVKLKQSYKSDFYQDRILKSINLIKEGGEWRILMERSLGMLERDHRGDFVGG